MSSAALEDAFAPVDAIEPSVLEKLYVSPGRYTRYRQETRDLTRYVCFFFLLSAKDHTVMTKLLVLLWNPAVPGKHEPKSYVRKISANKISFIWFLDLDGTSPKPNNQWPPQAPTIRPICYIV